MVGLVLCGGAGKRLWPLSTEARPKQYLSLFNGASLFELTLKRNAVLCDALVLALGAGQARLASEGLRNARARASLSLLEPLQRNTAPAIATVALALPRDEILLVCPSDHLVRDKEAYALAVRRAKALAQEGRLVLFGIKPRAPETGYGYIEHEGERVLGFTEKPDRAKAEAYCAGGRHSWNAGIFCFKVSALLDEMAALAPELLKACEEAFRRARGGGPGLGRLGRRIMPRMADMADIPSISIDYALMEKSKNIAVVPCDPGWSDLGSFDAIYEEMVKDDRGDAALTEGETLFHESTGSLVIQRGGGRVALVGVDGLVVVKNGQDILVTKRGSGQAVKQAAEALEARGARASRA
jgi:mannose-1-phosphate guanylyltransferase